MFSEENVGGLLKCDSSLTKDLFLQAILLINANAMEYAVECFTAAGCCCCNELTNCVIPEARSLLYYKDQKKYLKNGIQPK